MAKRVKGMKNCFPINAALRLLLQNRKLCTGCAAIVLTLIGTGVTTAVHAQDLLDREVSIEVKDVKLSDVLTELEEKAKVKFEYSPDKLRLNEIVSVSASKKKLREILTELLAPLAIEFTIHAPYDYILLKPVPQKKSDRAENSISMRVTGKVTDAVTNEPLPGVSVIVKGTANGVATNADGTYSIDASNGDLLIYSFISYKTFEAKVSEEIVIDVLLESESKTLGEVVVNAGYYSVADREKTGNISRVSSKVIEKQPVVNPLQSIQGRMPGITVTQLSGIPGGNFQVRIRGTNSLSNGNDPLYVIDGVPFLSEKVSSSRGQSLFGSRFEPQRGSSMPSGSSPLQSINPNDIESIEVLKDADVTAIYGSRAANGVVLITTKRGKAGKVKFNVDLKSGVSVVRNRMQMLNTKQYIAMRKQAVANDGDSAPRADEYDINGTWNQTRYTNWQDKLIGGTAQMTDLNASISGGNTGTQFVFGTGYNRQGVVFPGDNHAERFSTHFSVSHKTADNKLNVRISTNYSLTKSNLLAQDLTFFSVALAPNAPALFNSNGDLNWENSTWTNPLAYLLNRYLSKTSTLITNAELGYQVAKGLTIKSSFGLNEIQTEEQETSVSKWYRPNQNKTPANSASLTVAPSSVRSWIIEPQINYEANWKKGRLTTLIGGTYQNQLTERSETTYLGFPSDALVTNPNAASTLLSGVSSFAKYKYAALYGRINYSWGEKYFLNLTGRRDGSSRFGPGKKFANLGAVGAAWIFTEEPAVKNKLAWLSFGKVRSSFGLTGNDQIGDYRYVDTYAAVGQYQGIATLQPRRLFNPDYGWEVNKKMEVALELGFINDRILVTTAWYRNRSSNQLIDYKLAGTTGFTSVLLNSPAVVQNTGLEFEVNATNISKGNFTWTSSFNITVPKNKLVAFKNLESSSYANTYVIGKPLTIRKTYHYAGVDPATGLYHVEDVNNDGLFTPEDRTSVVVYAQNFYGGLNNSISFKGFQFDVFFQFVSQESSVATWDYFGGRFDSFFSTGNVPASVLDGDRWKEPGDQAQKQYFTRKDVPYVSSSDLAARQTYFVRLKNISLSYQVPSTFLKGVQSRVYMQVQNLFVITNNKELDPETGFSLPPLTTVVAGLQFSF